ncbi:hypothetical protein B296_00020300, partial [Ensete ventricosum]
PGQGKVIAPIVRFKHSNDELTRLSAVLLPLEELEGLLLSRGYQPGLVLVVDSTLLEEGSGIMSNQYNFPVFLLSPEAKSVVQEVVCLCFGYQILVHIDY